jgi:putative sporulation protein YtaF
MLWLSAALIAVVSNLDNLAAGVALGMRDTRVSAVPNAVIAAVTMAATAVAMTPGRVLSHAIPPSLATAIGASVISGMGAWTVFTSMPRERMPRSRPTSGCGRLQNARSPLGSEFLRSEVISSRDALVLGIALAANNVATGVGAGIAGVPPVTTTLLAGALSLLCVGGGSRVGSSLGRLIGGSAASLMSGLILLGVGAAILAGAG